MAALNLTKLYRYKFLNDEDGEAQSGYIICPETCGK